MSVTEYDPLAPEVLEDPYPFYAELRRLAPAYLVPARGFWVVSRYADVAGVLRRPELFSSSAMAAALTRPADFVPEEEAEDDWADEDRVSIIGADGAQHARLRDVVNRGFTPGRIAALAPRVRQIARELAEPLLGTGGCELVEDFAAPFPVQVIAELLGVDPERRADFKRWSDAIMAGIFDPEAEREAAAIGAALVEMRDYLSAVIEERRRQPGQDLISSLVRAEEEQGVLTPHEVQIFVFALLVAGSVTTTHLVSNMLLALMAHPAELARVVADPGLVPGAVEETLRYASPVHMIWRTATEDVEVGGTTIPKGATVAPLFASANRDEAAFPEPDRFDVNRNPKDHLAFGHGVHFCLGAALARLEARVALETLLADGRWPVLEETSVRWLPSMIFRGPLRLRLSFAG